MSNIDAVKQIMGELKNLRNNQDEKVANIEQQMKALKEAQRLTEEAVYRADCRDHRYRFRAQEVC